jgi:hypothetical protein
MIPWLPETMNILVGRASVPAIADGQGRPPHQFYKTFSAPARFFLL